MENAVPPIFFRLLCLAIPVLITWVFVRFVEPKIEEEKSKNQTLAPKLEPSNTQKIAATRQELDKLKQRLAKE